MRNTTQDSQCITCGLSGYPLNTKQERHPVCCKSPLLKQHHHLSVRDKFSYPYKTPGKTVVLYTVIFISLESKQEDKILWTEWEQVLPEIFTIQKLTVGVGQVFLCPAHDLCILESHPQYCLKPTLPVPAHLQILMPAAE